jgi:hypothetical protein
MARFALVNMSKEQLRPMFMRTGQSVLDIQRQRFLNERGMPCFTETNDNLLMWSHYGSGCRGFRLEFRTELLAPGKLNRVIYTPRMPKIDLLPLVVRKDASQLLQLFCTKSLAWSYEREWRCAHTKAGTPFCYQPHALKAVYLGPDIDAQSRDLICIILAAQNHTAELWLGRRSATEFKVEYEMAVDYTPRTLAKAKGWIPPEQ